MKQEARYTVTVDGNEFVLVPETFVEGAVRRQAEFAYLGEEDLKSRPDTREWLHNSWVGGAQWEKPVYGRNNQNTYFESGDVSMTDRAGSVQQSAELQPITDTGIVDSPGMKPTAWSEDSLDGALSIYNSTGTTWQWMAWDAASDDWTVLAGSKTFAGATYCMSICSGADGNAYALLDDGNVAVRNVSAATVDEFDTTLAVSNGAAIWASRDYVFVYNGDTIYTYDINDTYAQSTAARADDDDGVDAFSRSALWTGKPVIPEWSCTRAITTSEGIFYVKNILDGGLPVAKVYRLDRDASGSYILTPIGSLPRGAVAINLAQHLGSLLITTVPNFHRATLNADDQKVTVYHVTGKSIGAIGSPLGGTNIDETPVWLLGTHNEMLYIGGRKRLWLYDGRVGAFHAVHVESDTKYTDHGSGFTDMVTVDSTSGAGVLFQHSSQDGVAAAPYIELMIEDSLITTSDDTAFVTSNWFDFEIPMEEKTIYQVFYNIDNVRTNSTVTIQVASDDGAFTTVATVLHTANNVVRVPITPITGFKFQYKMIFSTDTVTSSSEPGRVYSIGFVAMGGEMVDVLAFTIDGNESMNIENEVQVPSDVYDLMATLRDNKEEIVVSHTMNESDPDNPQSATYRVMNVTGKKPSAQDGVYEVQLVEVAT